MSAPARTRRRHLTPLDATIYALLYRRVSSKEQAIEGGSLAAQNAMSLTSVTSIGAVLHDTYEDVFSGKRDDRREYQRLLAEARGLVMDGKQVVVIVPRLDRLGRNVAERVRAWEALKELGITLYSVREGGYVSELIYNLLAGMAQEEVRLLGERVSDTFQDQMAKGWLKPGSAPWGYTWRPSTPDERAADAPNVVAELDDDTAPYVVELFSRAGAGESFRALGRWASNLPSLARGDRLFHWSSIRYVLQSPVYVGRQGQYDDPREVLDRPVGRWPRLVDDGVWLRAQTSAIVREIPLPRQASGAFPLTGLLRCPNEGCGARMRGRTKPTHYRADKGYTQQGRREYVCSGSQGYGGCAYVAPAERLERAVLQTVRELYAALDRPDVAEPARAFIAAEEQREAAASDGPTIARLRTELAAETRRLTDMTKLVIDGVIDQKAYIETRTAIYTEQARIEAEIARLETTRSGRARPSVAPFAAALLESVVGWRTGFDEDRQYNPAVLRGAYEMLLETVYPVRVGRGQYEVRPVWTEVGRLVHGLAITLLPTENLVAVEQTGQTVCSTETITRPA